MGALPLLGIASHLKDALVVGVEVPQLSDGRNDLAGTSAAPVVWMCWKVSFPMISCVNFSGSSVCSVFFIKLSCCISWICHIGPHTQRPPIEP